MASDEDQDDPLTDVGSGEGSDDNGLDRATPKASHEQSLTDGQHVAVRLLAGREHARDELIRKLHQRGWSESQCETILDRLMALGLQSDERFAESFVRSRVQKAFGPVRIRAELQQRGIDRELIEQALRSDTPDWLAVAAGWYERRYGTEPIEDVKERGRRQAALARRGFSSDIIRELID